MGTKVRARVIGWAAVGLLWGSVTGWAQAQVGSQWLLNAAGSVNAGYSGSDTNEGPSSHGIGFGGNGQLSGSYHSPQFLTFAVAPFYDQSRNDSSFQSITDSSGVTTSATIFGGSKFPGYVNFSQVYNNEGSYLVPGIANYRTNGDTQAFGVGWSFRLAPTLTLRVGLQEGNNTFSIYGANGENSSHFRDLFASVNYSVAGFHFTGGVNNTDSNNSLPAVEGGESSQASKAGSTTYAFNLSHVLPLGGTTWLNLSRNTTGYNSPGIEDTESTDVATGGFALKPTRRVSTDFSADYDDNLAGTIYQAETAAGVLAPLNLPAEESHSWGVYGEAQYSFSERFYISGLVSHRQQLFEGTASDSTAYSGDVNYGRDLWGGKFTAGTIVTESSLGSYGGSLLGLLSNAIYIRKVAGWNLSGSAGYSRDVESILIGYTTSGYNYSVSASRRLRKLNWNGGAGGSRSMVSEVDGTKSTTQNYSTGLSTSRIGGSVAYAKSSGVGLYTAQGINSLPTGLPPSLLPNTVLYGGSSYSAGVGGSPIRGLTFSGSYVKSRSNTVNSSATSYNETEEANAYLQYRVRKIFFTAGYSRLLQGFTASSARPAMVSTYYVGLARWFNFF